MSEVAEPLVLETERPGVVVRELRTEADDAAFREAYDASRLEISEVDYLAFIRYRTVGDVTKAREEAARSGRVITGVWDGSKFVASVDFRPRPDGSVELGYWTDSRETGKKYASLGTAALVGYLSQSYQRIVTRVRDDNEASAHVSRNAKLQQIAHSAGWLTFELISKRPNPFSNIIGAEHVVAPGEYRVIDGVDAPLVVRPGDLAYVTGDSTLNPDPLPGVYHRGVFRGNDLRAGKPIVSFLYHKLDDDGQLETSERVILWEGIGYGTHPGHAGQPPTWYLVGPKLGTIDHETGQVLTGPEYGTKIEANHFSIACITDGPFGVPLLANPDKLPPGWNALPPSGPPQ